ncbi:MAG: ABC transporter substrate-binding protein [Rhodospirillales bacterium]
MLHRLAPFLFAFLIALPASGQEKVPDAVIEDFHMELLTVMKAAESLGVKGRYNYLEPAMSEAFDLPRMIRIATGSYWKRTPPEKQKLLLEAFKRLSVSIYAVRFDGWSGQAFQTLGVRPGPRNTKLVETRILRPGDSPVAITYVMKESEGRWRITDVLLDNSISELAVRRSEYRRVLGSHGLDGLIAMLNRKASDLMAK